MSTLTTLLLTTSVAAGVGGVMSIIGLIINSCVTKRRERSQHLWEMEVKRIQDLEERAGEIVELVASHKSIDKIQAGVVETLPRLESDAGRFLRHRAIALAIRALHHALMILLDMKKRGEDFDAMSTEVYSLYDKLLRECDRVTKKRRM